MNNIAFAAGYNPALSSAALQHDFALCMPNAATANDDRRILDKAKPYAARGIIFGFMLAVPLWAVIGECVSLAYGAIG